ncbi:DUF397 domain-containing protein [Streptomyces sp. NPDC001928]|uniref:DUF397 domain-containing protein n=1 Tax=Streptomyces sp. NPDC001928 TaxID=3154404 RepID=UPI00331D2669
MSELTWQKSTYSAEAANCVEIATTATTIHVRDSKNPNGPHLTLRPAAWASFHAHTIAAK